MFEVLIIGGGVSGMSCALVLGSAKIKNLQLKKQSDFHSSKSSSLQELFLITPIDSCRNIGLGFIVTALNSYPNSILMSLKYQTKSLKVEGQSPDFTITTNKTLIKLK
jgi:heterodisulfide reductase subunit A-like polyferredoxin